MRALLSIIAIAGLLSGCQSLGIFGSHSIPDGVVYINKSRLEKLVSVDGTGSVRTTTGTISAYGTLHNLTKGSAVFEVRATFSGPDGEPLEKPSGWQQVFIEPKSTLRYRISSLTPQAQTIFVEIREANLQ